MQKFQKPQKQLSQQFLPFWEKLKNNYPLALSKICKLFKRRTEFVPQEFFDRYQRTITDNLFGKVDPYSFPKELNSIILKAKDDFDLANKYAAYRKSLFFEALGSLLSHPDFSQENLAHFSSLLDALGKKGGRHSFELLMLFVASSKFEPPYLSVLDQLSRTFEPKNSLQFDSFFAKPINILSSDSFKPDYLPFLTLIAQNTSQFSTAQALDGLASLIFKPSFTAENSKKIYEIVSQEKDISLGNMLFALSTLLGNKNFKVEHLDEIHRVVKEGKKDEVLRFIYVLHAKLDAEPSPPNSSLGSACGGGA